MTTLRQTAAPRLRLAGAMIAIGAVLVAKSAAAQQAPEPEPTTTTTVVPATPAPTQPPTVAITTAPVSAPPATTTPVVAVVQVTAVDQLPSTIPVVSIPASTIAPPSTVPIAAVASTIPIQTASSIAVETSTTTSIDPNASTTTLETTTTTLPLVAEIADELDDTEPPPNISINPLPAPLVPVRDRSLEDVLKQLTTRQQALVAIAQKRADLAQARVQAATKAIEELEAKEKELQVRIAELARQMNDTRAKLRVRALAIYTGEDITAANSLLNSENFNDLARNVELVSQSQQRDRQLLDELNGQQAQLNVEKATLAETSAQRLAELETVIAEQQALNDALNKMQEQLGSLTSGASIALGGFVFPVTPPFNFIDSWGFPRMMGTKYAHTHQGTDIFGADGSPLLAVQRGVVTRIGTNHLGGNRIWLHAADGTEYYYAHLSAFVAGMVDGDVVEAGQTIGFLGESGNAKGGTPHLHFEVHPGGGAAVNPYPFLDAVRKNDNSEFLKAMAATATTTTLPGTVPGEIRAGIGFVREVAVSPIRSAAIGNLTPDTIDPTAPVTTLPTRPA